MNPILEEDGTYAFIVPLKFYELHSIDILKFVDSVDHETFEHYQLLNRMNRFIEENNVTAFKRPMDRIFSSMSLEIDNNFLANTGVTLRFNKRRLNVLKLKNEGLYQEMCSYAKRFARHAKQYSIVAK